MNEPDRPSKIAYQPPRRENPSQIIYRMTPEERLDVEGELQAETTEWSEHPLFNPNDERSNVFRFGKSCHIYNTDFEGNIVEDRRALFPKTLDYIAKWSNNDLKNLGRTYWHKLNPMGGHIDLHHDNTNGYFRTVKRYHIYLDVPLDFVVALDGGLWNVYADKRLSNAVISFNLYDWHYFINHTKEPQYMLIVDFYPPEITT